MVLISFPLSGLRTALSPSSLALFGASTSGAAYSVNIDGQIVGEADIAAGDVSHATLWNSSLGAAQDLGTLAGGSSSSAYFISDVGIIVGESDDGTGIFKAVMWSVDASGIVTSGPTELAGLNLNDAGKHRPWC